MNATLPSILIVGERGLGHETLARAFSNTLGNRFKSGLGEIMGFGSNLYDFFTQAGGYDTYYVCSVERMPPYYQHNIYTIIKYGTLDVPIFLENRTETYELENKLIILGAVDEKSFMPSFLKAIDIRVALLKYDPETLFKILKQRVEYLGWTVRSDEVLKLIACRSKGNAGNAVKIVALIGNLLDSDRPENCRLNLFLQASTAEYHSC